MNKLTPLDAMMNALRGLLHESAQASFYIEGDRAEAQWMLDRLAALGFTLAVATPEPSDPDLASVRRDTGGVFPDGTTNHPALAFDNPTLEQKILDKKDTTMTRLLQLLSAEELEALDAALSAVVLAGRSELAPYLSDRAESFVAALAAIDPPLAVVPLRAVTSGPALSQVALYDSRVVTGGHPDPATRKSAGAELGKAWVEAQAALPERLDERSLSFWFDTRKPSGWRAVASHRFDPLRPIPLIVTGFDTPVAALRALAAALSAPQEETR